MKLHKGQTSKTVDKNADRQKRTEKKSTFEQILAEHGIAGLIAVGVIGTICLIAIQQVLTHQAIDIPKYFTEISTLIVGYYFGAHSAKDKGRADEDTQ